MISVCLPSHYFYSFGYRPWKVIADKKCYSGQIEMLMIMSVLHLRSCNNPCLTRANYIIRLLYGWSTAIIKTKLKEGILMYTFLIDIILLATVSAFKFGNKEKCRMLFQCLFWQEIFFQCFILPNLLNYLFLDFLYIFTVIGPNRRQLLCHEAKKYLYNSEWKIWFSHASVFCWTTHTTTKNLVK